MMLSERKSFGTPRSIISRSSENTDKSNEEIDQRQNIVTSKYLAPNHQRLLLILSRSDNLSPIHVDIKNESYWYAMRRRMGPRKHNALIVEQNISSGRWESFIYKMKPRDEDLEIVPMRQFLTSHKSKWSAIKNCEIAAKDRDANPYENVTFKPVSSVDIRKMTHFRRGTNRQVIRAAAR